MPPTKRTAQRKRRSKAVLALGAAGLSLSLASSASAAVGGMNGGLVQHPSASKCMKKKSPTSV